MRCADCKWRNLIGTLDYCPRFGLRIYNGAIFGHLGGIEIVECQNGEPA